MKKFDIFIKGINPERNHEAEQIKENAAKILQISLSDLDDLLAQKNGACIRRGSPENEAQHYQRTLGNLGLICIYSPERKQTSLELIPMAVEAAADDEIICPNCQHEMSADEDGVLPEKCEQCGITIAKFLEQKLQAEEREAIKLKLLAAQNIAQQTQSKKLQEDIEKQRKLNLEKDVLNELEGGKTKNPLNVKLLVIGGGLLIATASASYFLTQSNVPPAKTNSASSSTTGTETEVAADSTTQVAAANINPKTGAPLSAQEAMQKTHDQAAQVLKGFGLNADAFANSGNSGGEAIPPTEEMLSEMAAATTNVSNATAGVNTNASPTNANATTVSLHKKLETPELFSVLNNDMAWDYFLKQNSKILLERQLPENAAKLSKYIVSHEVYIDAIGELLRAAQQAKQTKLVDDYLAAIEMRLTTLQPEQQAIYFAQASRYLALENGSNRLLLRAENLLASLPKPELQLNVVLKLAVMYSKAGNVTNANNYFSKINALLASITDLDMQVQLRTAVAKAYQDINNTTVAVQWLNSSEPLIKQLKSETLSVLVTSYATCNQSKSVLNLLAQIDAKEHYDTWLYQAIGASLEAGFMSNALELNKNFQSASYKALANVLIAAYSPINANELLSNTEQSLNGLSPFEKAIVASQLVDYYGKLKNTAKIETFLTLSQTALDSFSASDAKDVLLEAVIKHYIHGFQIKAANNLLIAIQSTTMKTHLNIEINQLANVAGLLK